MAKYSLDKQSAKKIAVGAGIAAGGAVLTYLSSVVSDVDFGQWSPVVMAAFSILVNAFRQFIKE